MGTDVLAQIARELVATVQRDVKTDWTVRDDVRAKLRSSIKRLLIKYRCPPDQQPGAVKLVLEQMERLAPTHSPAVSPNVQEAKTRLSDLLLRSERREEIVIARAGRPVAKLVPVEPTPPRQFGMLRLEVPDDFDEPLSEDELAAWE